MFGYKSLQGHRFLLVLRVNLRVVLLGHMAILGLFEELPEQFPEQLCHCTRPPAAGEAPVPPQLHQNLPPGFLIPAVPLGVKWDLAAVWICGGYFED